MVIGNWPNQKFGTAENLFMQKWIYKEFLSKILQNHVNENMKQTNDFWLSGLHKSTRIHVIVTLTSSYSTQHPALSIINTSRFSPFLPKTLYYETSPYNMYNILKLLLFMRLLFGNSQHLYDVFTQGCGLLNGKYQR